MSNKINLAIAIVGVGLLLTVTGRAQKQLNATANSRINASQKSTKASGKYAHLAAALRSIAGTIEACPRVIEFDASKDSQADEGPLALSRLYYGPPIHVQWAVSYSNSVPSPSQGYVQFSIPRAFWIPPEVRKRWGTEAADLYDEMLEARSPLEYRYTFGTGPRGLRLIRILSRSADQSKWNDVPLGDKACLGCALTCWRRAAKPNSSSHR